MASHKAVALASMLLFVVFLAGLIGCCWLWSARSGQITDARFQEIQLGMPYESVAKLIRCAPGDYTSVDVIFLVTTEEQGRFGHDKWFPLIGPATLPTRRSSLNDQTRVWSGNSGQIEVKLDANQLVIDKCFRPALSPRGDNPLTNLFR